MGSALRPYRELAAVPAPEAVGAETMTGYRVRAKLVASGGRLGLFARGGHELVDVPECIVLSPNLRDVAQGLRGALPPEVTALDLRDSDSGVLVTLIARRGASKTRLTAFAEGLCERLPLIAGVALGFRDPDSPQLLGDEPELVAGVAALPHHFDPAAPWHYAAHGAFTQVHPDQTRKLHQAVEQRLERTLGGLRGRRILELHGGAGLLAMRLSAREARVTLVEAFAPASERAAQAARDQGLSLTTITGDASDLCEKLIAKG
ncbi:MAG TPA: hypothetical protein VGP93_05105, partial [Polyangiaceae bacterium]|nr:hypothetical protein [Polyangiaceae bacterium]